MQATPSKASPGLRNHEANAQPWNRCIKPDTWDRPEEHLHRQEDAHVQGQLSPGAGALGAAVGDGTEVPEALSRVAPLSDGEYGWLSKSWSPFGSPKY